MAKISQLDHEFASYAATEAGRLLLEIRAGKHNLDSSNLDLGAYGDVQSHELLVQLISDQFPDDMILSEEANEDPRRISKDRVWIIDPLDGTREYCIKGRTDWAVHVALSNFGMPEVGAVALPNFGKTYSTLNPPQTPLSTGPIKIVYSRTRTVPVAEFLSKEMNGELLRMGSAGAKSMAVINGDADIYVHAGGQYEWDSCAPVAVALASGIHASRLDGTPLRYNQKDLHVPDLLICRKELVDPVLTLLR